MILVNRIKFMGFFITNISNDNKIFLVNGYDQWIFSENYLVPKSFFLYDNINFNLDDFLWFFVFLFNYLLIPFHFHLLPKFVFHSSLRVIFFVSSSISLHFYSFCRSRSSVTLLPSNRGSSIFVISPYLLSSLYLGKLNYFCLFFWPNSYN